jgi:hypothetical protein
VTTRRSLSVLSAAALLAVAIAAPAMGQSSAPASVPAGPAITVVATDYHFGGLPTTVPAGTTLSLTNEGKELHELVLARKNDGVTQTWDELLQMSDTEVFQYVSLVGDGTPLFAASGQTAEGSFTLAQEGEYIALCFIPQGMTELPTDPNASMDPALLAGTPHFMLGMIQTFTVTPAGSEVGPLPSAAPMAPMGSPEASPAG